MRLACSILSRISLTLLIVSGLGSFPIASRADLWSTAYYAGWMQSYMPASNIDFAGLSHVIHFSVVPNSNGSLNSTDNSVTPSNSADVVSRAHAAGRHAIICVGGAGSQVGFQGATSGANISMFITNLVTFMVARGYDGVDIDWEPLDASDGQQYTNFVNGLRTALDAITPRPLLTAAVASQPSLFASLQTKFDQINLMTYDMSGPYPGWVTWFNAPIFDGGYHFQSTGGLIPSADGMVNTFIAAGVSPGKLSIGIAFYGWVWSGGTGTSTGGAALPRQTWAIPPTTSTPTYETIMSSYYQPQLYHWDTNAQAAYLSIDNPGSANDKFISYDDEHTCQAKVSYARNRRLGGVMIWELGSGYRALQPNGQRDPLLQAVKQALATPRLTAIQFNGPDAQLSFTSLPLALYRVQWTSNLTAGVWNAVTSNVSGTGGVLQIADPGALSQSLRFYRVQTPP